MKCKCIRSSSWFLIDDSLEQNLKGGKFEFILGEEYSYKLEENNFFGNFYHVYFDSTRHIGFETSGKYNFFDHFEIL
jgi:hypothetical protein